MRVLLFASATDEYVIPAFWDMVKILEYLAEKVHVITSSGAELCASRDDKVVIHRFRMILSQRVASLGFFGRILCYLEHELRMFFHMRRLRKEVDVILSFQSVGILTVFLSCLLKRKSVVYVGGNPQEALFEGRSSFSRLLAIISILLWRIHIHLTTEVVAISPSIPRNFNMKKKTHYAYVRLLNQEFRITKPFMERRNIIGYVGRLEDKKGVLELVDAFSLIRQNVDAHLLVVGEGTLREQIENVMDRKELLSSVTLTGWVSNVHEYLNEMRLLVLPSKTEGTPSVILEAMACGTPVLATPTGDIEYLIKDDSRGFLLESIESIDMSRKIVELLSEPRALSQAAENASVWVKTNFSLEQIMDQWRKIFNELRNKDNDW